METIKNNFEILVEKIQEKNIENEVEKKSPIFEGVDLNEVFEEIEVSLENYRFHSDKKYNDSKMELANIFLSI